MPQIAFYDWWESFESRGITLSIGNCYTNTGIWLDYEYAGGKSSPPPVAVDGPDTAETGASVEYVAEGNMLSNVPNS